MGRSVSHATGSISICYRVIDHTDDLDQEWTWEDLKEGLQETAKDAWPSLETCDEWLGREDHALLENAHAYIGLSEYCGLISIWLVPKTGSSQDHPELAEHWCQQIAPKFEKLFGEYRKIATASNGESFYEKV